MASGAQREREDLVQELIERMMAIMRKVRHDTVPGEPLLSMPQLHILFTIAMKKGAGVSVSELAESSGVTPGAVTQFVKALVEQDLVARESDPNDRRVVRLCLTPKARGQMARMRREYLKAAARTFGVLSIEDIRTLNDILTRLNVPIEKEETSPDGRDKAGLSSHRT